MAAAPGIIFQDPQEPPNPYSDNPQWRHARLPASSSTQFPSRRPNQQQQSMLPPSSVSLAIQVIQDTAKATLAHRFQNDYPFIIRKGIYQFPLPHGSSVIDFKCRIGNTRTIHGQVKPRDAAQDEYNHAAQQGRTVGLVEQNTPEIFSTAIGNIPRETTVEAEVSFVFFLKHNFAQTQTITTLTMPTYIAPRYGSPGFELGETGPQRNRSLSIDIEILAIDGNYRYCKQ